METIGAYEAKTHLPKLLERVARGDAADRGGVPGGRFGVSLAGTR